MKPIILLEVDWEQELRSAHNLPKRRDWEKMGFWTQKAIKDARKTLNSRIKEIKRMIVAGEARYK